MQKQRRWFRHQQVIFDCDSTLSRIEGIDLLAKRSGKFEQVKAMTDAAMDGNIPLEQIYGERLALIKPSQADICDLSKLYLDHIVDDAQIVIALLQNHGHEVHIVSGGLYEPVRNFGVAIGVKAQNIHAVKVGYDQLSGQWWLPQQQQCQYLDHDRGPLTKSDGKRDIIEQIQQHHAGRSLLIGDGVSDLLAASAVDQFIGYGGVESRAKVRDAAEVFIRCESLLPVLALAGSQVLIKWLCFYDKALAQKTYHLLAQDVEFTDNQLKQELLAYFY